MTELEQYLLGLATAQNVAYSTLVSEIEVQLGFDGQKLIDRLAAIAKATEASDHVAERSASPQLSTLINVLRVGRKTSWNPTVISGSRPDDDKPT